MRTSACATSATLASPRVSARARADSAPRPAPASRAFLSHTLCANTLALATSAIMATSSVSFIAAIAAPPAAFAADTTFCRAKCAKECLRIAPGSDGYCADACADECDAMASDGEDISESSTSSVFATKKENSGFEGMLVGIVDKSAVFFAPNAELAKDPACGPDE